jgi:amino acid adenylation domain-containing protein/non-ribosomal peptide synthase protein (TIGR01720 family)
VVGWNRTRREYPRGATIAQVFEDQARRTPEAVAVVFDGERLSYGELDERANRLAWHLRELGVGADTRVAICCERSLQMVVGLLGILKAGGAYVPLDPSYPSERLGFMLADSDVRVLVTQEGLSVVLPGHAARVVRLDADGEQIARQSAGAPPSVTNAEDLAYVIYTSGSTGIPKGIAVTHRAVNRLVLNTDYVPVQPSDRIAQASNASFDAATFEIWGALLNGACLVGVSREASLSPRDLAAVLREQGVTILFLTTALFNAVAREDASAFSGLRHLLFGGEAVDPARVREVLEGGPPRRLLHVYGPTETTTYATWHLVEEVPEDATTVPIGRPIANTTAYVLDARMNAVPVGVAGELYLGGDGLARGYLGRPELTAEKFVPDPFGGDPGGRLYRTGDLVRHREDGSIEFLGRIDHQVKVRGFRIELGEIEALLRRQPVVKDAVVVLREDHPGDKRLAAYVTAEDGQTLDTSELQRRLKGKLPEYMVPSAVVCLESLPLNPNGKVDRGALPVPDAPRCDEALVLPRNDVEKRISAIWSEVLHVDEIGVHDNFFALGGDSILSIQIVARAAQAGLHFTPREIFQHQTVAELAAVAATASGIAEAEQNAVSGALPLTPIQRWFFEQDLPAPQHFNQALVLEAARPLDVRLLEKALAQLEAHHDALRLRFTRGASGWEQEIVAFGPEARVQNVDLSAVAPGHQPAAVEAVAAGLQRGLSLADGPLLRAAWFELGADRRRRLLLVIHHLAVDGVSWRILLEDLETAYGQLERGEDVRLPAKTTSFREWARRLSDHAQSTAVREELAYWASVAGAPDLPTDRRGGANDERSAENVVVSLDEDETAMLLRLVPARFHTEINDVLLTALALSFAQWTGEPRLSVDVEGHGREDILPGLSVARTVGWFTSVFPVALDVDRAATPVKALERIRQQLRRIPAKGIGFGLLRYLCSDRGVVAALQGRPQPEVSFNYLGQLDHAAGTASLLLPARESTGPPRDPGGRRAHLIDVTGLVVGGRLRMTWIYGMEVHDHRTIERLAQTFVESLRAILVAARRETAPVRVPARADGMDPLELETALRQVSFE